MLFTHKQLASRVWQVHQQLLCCSPGWWILRPRWPLFSGAPLQAADLQAAGWTICNLTDSTHLEVGELRSCMCLPASNSKDSQHTQPHQARCRAYKYLRI